VAQIIYDDAEFFAAYSSIPRSVEGLDGAAEWPTLGAMLPDVAGLRVVDLGCGLGWFCRWAVAAGAASVLGIDLSENMLARATAAATDPRITYQRQDLDDVDLAAGAYELAYSSLTLHYLGDLGDFVAKVHGFFQAAGSSALSSTRSSPLRQHRRS